MNKIEENRIVLESLTFNISDEIGVSPRWQQHEVSRLRYCSERFLAVFVVLAQLRELVWRTFIYVQSLGAKPSSSG